MTTKAETLPSKILRAFIFFLATLLLYFGVVLLGWGIYDLNGYFSIPQRTGYAVVAGLFSLAVGLQAYSSTEGIRGSKGEESKFVYRQRIVRIGLVLSLYLALFFIPFFDRRGMLVFDDGSLARWVGVALSAFGFLLIFWSGLALGRQYSADVTIQTDHRLITNSIYHTIRHPRYLGIILLSTGFSLIFRSWIGLLASIVFLGVILYRIRSEEAVLHGEFGKEWETYCQCSWRLLPYIY
jgi:protein-S-isoprenylcysteine O-methyltransferase Ste14